MTAEQAGEVGRHPISGSYEGETTGPTARRYLVLRIDVDSRGPYSATMNCVSGDFFELARQPPDEVPGGSRRVYVGSWIVRRPEIVFSSSGMEITGEVDFWVYAPRRTFMQMHVDSTQVEPIATAVFRDAVGSEIKYVCKKASDCFREVSLEVDICESVSTLTPRLPEYEIYSHSERPPDVGNRILTLQGAYREAGVCIILVGDPDVIDDAPRGSNLWSAAELHHAMEHYFAGYSGEWAAWRAWGIIATRFEIPEVGGLMFDSSAATGGAGLPPERQGLAVFGQHWWFRLQTTAPSKNDDEAAANRKFLWTWVHELGHVLNLVHPNHTGDLTWMNYDWRYEADSSRGSFWRKFRFCFADDELLHIRHGNRSSVIMGGDLASGDHAAADRTIDSGLDNRGISPIGFLVRSKQYFSFMEPVFVELRIRNLTPTPVEVDTRLRPDFGLVDLMIERPDGCRTRYSTPMHLDSEPALKMLQPTGPMTDGSDRHSEYVFLSYGSKGFYFDVPGEYFVKAAYYGCGGMATVSNRHRVVVGAPSSTVEDRLSQNWFSSSMGMILYLQGSPSPFLSKGVDLLNEVMERFPGSMIAVVAAEALARTAGMDLFEIDRGSSPALRRIHSADTTRAVEILDQAIRFFKQARSRHFNIPYHRMARRLSDYKRIAGDERGARSVLRELGKDLEARGVRKQVISDIGSQLGNTARE
jgi:hypothetical protein